MDLKTERCSCCGTELEYIERLYQPTDYCAGCSDDERYATKLAEAGDLIPAPRAWWRNRVKRALRQLLRVVGVGRSR